MILKISFKGTVEQGNKHKGQESGRADPSVLSGVPYQPVTSHTQHRRHHVAREGGPRIEIIKRDCKLQLYS